MAGIVFPNIANSLLPLMQMDRQAEESRLGRERLDRNDQWLMQDRKESRELQQMKMLRELGTEERAKVKEQFEVTGKAAAGILSLPDADQPAAYEATYNALTQQGYKINLPSKWSPSLKSQLQAYAVQVPKYLEMLGGQPQAMPPVGGAPAPGAAPGGADPLAQSAGAISSIESGGKYDAVGPAADAKGSRAYGKYQVMDFNVGPWTQEALGKAMTPQEYLSSPEAQDAVFKHKFGQYIQQYGSPEAASRAWFAGPGGMNNPNAKDVLGTNVAGYAEKFNKSMGGPQVAQMPPQGDAVAGQGDAPPRAAPPAIGNEIDEIRKQTRASGGDIFTVKDQIEIQNGNYVVRSLQNPRQIIGMIPVKDKAAGPAGPFAGNNPDVQAFNHLVSTGKMTVEQAANVLGGKSITNPADGSVIFVPATQLAGVGGAPSPTQAPPAPGGAAAAPAPNAAPGTIALTPPKKELALKKLETEIRAVESSIANFQKVITEAGGGSFQAFINDPTSAPAQKVLGAYNALKTALRSEAFVNTGVLQPGEAKMLDEMLLSPTSVRGLLATPDAYGAMLDQVLVFIKGKMDAAGVAYGQQPTPKAAEPSAVGAPNVGEVQDGYRFKGGDPSQPSSWEKAQ